MIPMSWNDAAIQRHRRLRRPELALTQRHNAGGNSSN
jgi:hypothetical protein